MVIPVVRCDWVCRLVSRINGFEVQGIEFVPLVVIVSSRATPAIIAHEKIHFYQMLETLIVGYYLIYAAHYLILRFRHPHRMAYALICLEREAYRNQANADYLKTRKWFAWARGI